MGGSFTYVIPLRFWFFSLRNVCVCIYILYILRGGARRNKGREGGWGVSECKRKNIEVKSKKETNISHFPFKMNEISSLISKMAWTSWKLQCGQSITIFHKLKSFIKEQSLHLKPFSCFAAQCLWSFFRCSGSACTQNWNNCMSGATGFMNP